MKAKKNYLIKLRHGGGSASRRTAWRAGRGSAPPRSDPRPGNASGTGGGAGIGIGNCIGRLRRAGPARREMSDHVGSNPRHGAIHARDPLREAAPSRTRHASQGKNNSMRSYATTPPRDANERQDMGESAAIARNCQELPAIAGNFGNSHASPRDGDSDPFRHAPRTLDRAPPPAEESQPEGAVRTTVDGPSQAPRTPSLRSPAATTPRPRAAWPPPPSPASGGA